MAQNRAAWIKSSKESPLVVDEAPMWKPEKDQVLIKNGAVAINPVDWMTQDSGLFSPKSDKQVFHVIAKLLQAYL